MEMIRYLLVAVCLVASGGCASGSEEQVCDDCPAVNLPVRPVSSRADSLRLQAALDGQYASGLSLHPVAVTGIGPGQEVVFTLRATGLRGIGQFDLYLQPEPATTFDMAGSVFQPRAPFVTFASGVEQSAQDGRVRLIGVDLQRSTNGEAELGTLHLKTGADFSGRELLLRAVFFSIGPRSTERDNYEADDLRLGITVNPARGRLPVKG
ncbi:MAG: hypothetical protein AB1505_03085 [Candidatus Latescibacterota bacterium]